MEALQILRDALEKFKTWFATDKTIASIKTSLTIIKTWVIDNVMKISRWVATRQKPFKNLQKFINFLNENMMIVIPVLFVGTIITGVLVIGLSTTAKNNYNFVKDRVEYRQDTIIFKLDDTSFGFSGTEIDTLKKYFRRANRLDKYCKRHVDEDYEILLGELAGVKIKFDYDSSPWNNSTIDMTLINGKWFNGMVIVHPRKDFMNYFTKYPRIYKKVAKKEKRKARKLEKLLTI